MYEFTLRLRWLENHVSNMTKYLNSRLSAKLNNVDPPRKATVRREDGWCKWNSRRGLTSEQVSSLSSLSIISSNKEEASDSTSEQGEILSWVVERFMSAINGCHVLSGNHSFNWHLNIIIRHIFEQRSSVRPGLAGEQGDIPTRLYFHPGRNFCHGLF